LHSFVDAALVQLIISRSDSELEVQSYDMKKNTSTVDRFLKTEMLKLSFHFLNFKVGLDRFLEN